MALSDSYIKGLVQKYTHDLIGKSDYTTLRQYLLKREPIADVINPIKAEVSEDYATEKLALSNRLTQRAYTLQEESDVQDTIIDEHERTKDTALSLDCSKELPILEDRERALEQKYTDQKYQYDAANKTLRQLKEKRDQCFRQQSLSHFPQTITSHVHGHSQSSFVQVHPGPIRSHHHFWIRESLLNLELLGLNNKISRIQENMEQINRELSSCGEEKKQTKKQIDEKKKLLLYTLPNQERVRQLRSNQRSIRGIAKQNQSANNLRLSPEKLTALHTEITDQTHELSLQYMQLFNNATQESYQVYLKELETALKHNKELKISSNECSALQNILILTNSLIELREKQNKSIHLYIEAQNKQTSLETMLKEKTDQVQKHTASGSKWEIDNIKIAETNNQLIIKKLSYATHTTNALRSAFVGLGGSFISGAVLLGLFNYGIIGSLLIGPILFAIPAALGLAALVSSIVALVANCQASSTGEEINRNLATISDNKSQRSKATKATEAIQKSLPDLKRDIDQARQNGTLIKEKIDEQESAIERLLAKANAITCMPDYSFFTPDRLFSAEIPSNTVILPTAPAAERPSNVVNFPTAPNDEEAGDPTCPPEQASIRMI